jgi:Uma2 family endonuclease
LGIGEYWVIDSRGSQVLIFKLQSDGTYAESQKSFVLKGLTVNILSQALQKLHQTTNVSAASWLVQQISVMNMKA